MNHYPYIASEHIARRTLGIVAALSAVGLFTLVTSVALAHFRAPSINTQEASAVAASVPTEDFFEHVALRAHAAYVYDAHTKEALFTQNQDVQLPLASLTKMMLALVVYEHVALNAIVTITASDLEQEGDAGLVVGEDWRVGDLIDFMLITSSNDAAAALGRAVTTYTGEATHVLMNEKAKLLGLSQTYFVNETGLDSNLFLAGAYGSAADMAKLFSTLYHTAPEVFAATLKTERSFTTTSGSNHHARNTNVALPEMPGLVFGKTGFTDLAGGNLAIVFEPEPNRAFVVVVLGSTIEERFSDVVALMHATRPSVK